MFCAIPYDSRTTMDVVNCNVHVNTANFNNVGGGSGR